MSLATRVLLRGRPLTLNTISVRSTWVLRRKVKLSHQPRLQSPIIVGPFLNPFPRYKEPRPVGDFIYDEVEDTDLAVEPKLRVILLKTVDELGVPGDVVEVDRDYGRFELLSSQAAVYASEYNLNKYRELIESDGKDRSGPSSAYVMPTIKRLSREVVVVTMSDEHPWTITPNHVRIAFRTIGYQVPNECIELPQTEISGPDLEGKQGKDFAVLVTINQREKVHVRCMVHHIGQPLRLAWNRAPRFVLLEEQQELLEKMPVNAPLEEDEYAIE